MKSNSRHFLKTLTAASLICFATSAAASRGPVDGIDTTTPYLIYYGNWTTAKVESARLNYKMVILHPVSNITAADIATIQAGPDASADTSDDVIVIAYISAGEDNRTSAPVAGDGTGPRVDPRASDTDALLGIDPLGVASTGGTGYASYYLDDEDSDGEPDTNTIFGGPYVNPGATAWYTVLQDSTVATDGIAGLNEILTSTTGNALACDGVFLDTLDTCAPNSYGATSYEWTTPGYQTLVAQISTDYPSKIIVGNRGVFFYNPNLKQYEFTLRPYLNMVLYESYYTDSSDSNTISPFFDDNKYNWAPKLNAEAGRPDGFTMIGLGYDQPVDLSQTIIDQDYLETMGKQGWPIYRTDGLLSSAFSNEAQTWLAANPDTTPPVWDSTAATSADSDSGTSGNQAPTQRIGVQEAVSIDQGVTLRWDIARDQTGPIRYNVYYTADLVMNFETATKLSAVSPSIPTAYLEGTGAGIYPYEYSITGLTNGTEYTFAIRAEDSATSSQEDTNTVTLTATPAEPYVGHFATIAIDGVFTDWDGIDPILTDESDSATIDFKDVYIANDNDYLYVRFSLYTAAPAFASSSSHVFVDTDGNSSTGYSPGITFGSEFFIESAAGYDQRNGGFNEGTLTALDWAIASDSANINYEFRISRTALFADLTTALGTLTEGLRILLQDGSDSSPSYAGSTGVEFTIATPSAYDTWKLSKFSTVQLIDPLTTGNTADPDADTLLNLMEFALGYDPLVANSNNVITWTITSASDFEYFDFDYIRSQNTGLSFTIEKSTDLSSTWDTSMNDLTELSIEDLSDGTERVTTRLAPPISSTNSQSFLRLSVSQ